MIENDSKPLEFSAHFEAYMFFLFYSLFFAIINLVVEVFPGLDFDTRDAVECGPLGF